MGFKSDIEIAQETPMEQITVIADKLGIEDRYLEQYGKYKAKIDYNLLKETKSEDGKLILENEDLVYQGDARSGKIEGLMSVSEGILEVKEEKDVLKAAEVLFSLIEIDR